MLNTPVSSPSCLDPKGREGLVECVELVRREYVEMPGLCLTRRQAQRYWSLSSAVCDVVLEALEAEGFLRRTPDGTYVRPVSH